MIRRIEARWRWNGGADDVAHIIEGPEGWRSSGRSGGVLWWIGEAGGRATFVEVRAKGIAPIRLQRDTDGEWLRPDGSPAAPGSDFPDIGVTAYTNSLPIRTLGLGIGKSAEITALWLPPPDFVPRPARQLYTRLGEREWRYENLDSDFAAVLPVDAEGLVLDYPGICERAR